MKSPYRRATSTDHDTDATYSSNLSHLEENSGGVNSSGLTISGASSSCSSLSGSGSGSPTEHQHHHHNHLGRVSTVLTPSKLDSRKKAGATTVYFYRTFIMIPALVLFWYVSAVFAITTSKKTMNVVPLPFLLCTTQFVVASALISVYTFTMNSYKPVQSAFQTILYQISSSYTMGFVFTNMAFSIVSASFAETVKSAEPVSSVALAYYYFNEGTTLPTYLTLIPICTGVAISCLHDDSFNLLGFTLAAASNICFSSRAVLAKKFFKQHVDGLDEINLFYHISTTGLMILIPLVIFFEGRSIHQLLANGTRDGMTSVPELFMLFFLNGCAYTAYNLTSFIILGKTNVITHAVLNVFRRVFIILFTAYYFGVELSALNMVGVGLAVIGVLSFALARSREKF
jgi:drug/metabolite transporter (DMT)-like permease